MSKKGTEAVTRKLDEYYAQLPEWYWKYGLHDAVILSVSELQLAPDYKNKNPKYNCLEIELDSKDAIYERDIKALRFYNYKIKTADFDIKSIEKQWWMSDTIKETDNKRHLLEIEIASAKDKRKYFVVEFEIAEIERK